MMDYQHSKYMQQARRFIFLLMTLVLFGAIAQSLTGCATVREAQEIPAPKTFAEAVAITHGEIGAIRETTAFMLRVRRENCVANPGSDLCKFAVRVDETTRDARDRLDQAYKVHAAFTAGLRPDCTITYEDMTVSCEDEVDRVAAGIVELRNLLVGGAL